MRPQNAGYNCGNSARRQIECMSLKQVEEFSTPGDFKRGFDELRQYGADD